MRALLLIVGCVLCACGAPLEHVRPKQTTAALTHATTSQTTGVREARRTAPAPTEPAARTTRTAKRKARKRAGKRRVKPFHISIRRGRETVTNLRIIGFDPKHPERMWIDKTARKRIKALLRDKRHKRDKRIPERLLWYMYLVGQHFDAPLEIVSGYRSRERKTSRHRHMRAVDFRIRGVDPKAIWSWAKRFDNVGLGWYPTSKFVHLDVRKKSAYWIDDSGPGQRARYRRGVPQTRAKVRRSIR